MTGCAPSSSSSSSWLYSSFISSFRWFSWSNLATTLFLEWEPDNHLDKLLFWWSHYYCYSKSHKNQKELKPLLRILLCKRKAARLIYSNWSSLKLLEWQIKVGIPNTLEETRHPLTSLCRKKDKALNWISHDLVLLYLKSNFPRKH